MPLLGYKTKPPILSSNQEPNGSAVKVGPDENYIQNFSEFF
jgi:hypothetical protein